MCLYSNYAILLILGTSLGRQFSIDIYIPCDIYTIGCALAEQRMWHTSHNKHKGADYNAIKEAA